jgi:ribosomal protein S18 acetylase RimI-like enzyme
MATTAFSVRAMTAADLAAVERIYTTLARRTAGPRLDELVRGADTRAVALVGVTARGRVAGYLVGDVRSFEFGSEPAGWILALGVDPHDARAGLGRQLLDEAVRRFATLGIRTIRTMVRRDDVPVLRFFRSERFVAGPYQELELDLEEARPWAPPTQTA